MLISIELKNFKSYERASLPLSAMTFLIGANASGKSNVLEAIRLLNWLAKGVVLMTSHDLFRVGMRWSEGKQTTCYATLLQASVLEVDSRACRKAGTILKSRLVL